MASNTRSPLNICGRHRRPRRRLPHELVMNNALFPEAFDINDHENHGEQNKEAGAAIVSTTAAGAALLAAFSGCNTCAHRKMLLLDSHGGFYLGLHQQAPASHRVQVIAAGDHEYGQDLGPVKAELLLHQDGGMYLVGAPLNSLHLLGRRLVGLCLPPSVAPDKLQTVVLVMETDLFTLFADKMAAADMDFGIADFRRLYCMWDSNLPSAEEPSWNQAKPVHRSQMRNLADLSEVNGSSVAELMYGTAIVKMLGVSGGGTVKHELGTFLTQLKGMMHPLEGFKLVLAGSAYICSEAAVHMADQYADVAYELLTLPLFPKLDGSGKPVTYSADPQLEWCHPGGGSVLHFMRTSGMADVLLAAGINHLFFLYTNNRGVTLLPRLLLSASMHDIETDVLIPVCERTKVDRWRPAICYIKGRLTQREQHLEDKMEDLELQDLIKYRYMPAGNLLVPLSRLLDAAECSTMEAALPLHWKQQPVDRRLPSTTSMAMSYWTEMGSTFAGFNNADLGRTPT